MAGDKWVLAAVTVLVSVLKQEKVEGRQAETGWKTNSYQAVVDALAAANHPAKTVRQVTDKWGTVCCAFYCPDPR